MLPSEYIFRYRLEKQYPAAAVSDVIRPIVFYLDPALPPFLVPWITRGIEAWQVAFERIGFRNAIVAREAPSEARGSAWQTFIQTHNAIVWDLRGRGPGRDRGMVATRPKSEATGEVLAANVLLGPGTIEAFQRHAFVALGNDPAMPPIFPDSLLGQIALPVIMHEIGHTLGLSHNFKASSTYPTDSLRSKAFVRRMGHSPSIMDYALFNAVAQPEDGLSLQERIAGIGPYDVFALHWAYSPISGAVTPEAELPMLEVWRTAQDTAAYLRSQAPDLSPGGPFGARGTIDPSVNPQDLGGDPITAAQAMIRNLARVGTRLAALRGSESAKVDPVLLTSYQNYAIDYWARMLSAATMLIGSSEPIAPYARDAASQRFAPVDAARQIAALRLVVDRAFRGQDAFLQTLVLPGQSIPDAAALSRVDTLPHGWSLGKFRQTQARLLDELLAERVLEKIEDQHTKLRNGVLPVFCAELASLRRETGSETNNTAYELQRRLNQIVTDSTGYCRRHGWVPIP